MWCAARKMMSATTGMSTTFTQSETMSKTLGRRGAEGVASLISDVLSGIIGGYRIEHERARCVVRRTQVERHEHGDPDADSQSQPEGRRRLPKRRARPNRIGQRSRKSAQRPTA